MTVERTRDIRAPRRRSPHGAFIARRRITTYTPTSNTTAMISARGLIRNITVKHAIAAAIEIHQGTLSVGR